MTAIHNGNINVVAELLIRGVSIDIKGPFGTVEREPPSESDGGSQGVCYAVSLVMRHKHTLSVRPKTKYKFDNMRHQQTLSVRPKTTF